MTNTGQVTYLPGQRETHVIIAGGIFPWKDKAPYVRSGHSLLGALEYDAASDEVKCHICGEWTKSIPHHVLFRNRMMSSTHGTVREYRLRHGFRLQGSPLATPAMTAKTKAILAKVRVIRPFAADNKHCAVRLASIAASRRKRHEFGVNERSETANLEEKCQAQRLKRLRQLANELGRSPTIKELRSLGDGLHPRSLEDLFGVSVSQVFIQAGIAPRKQGNSLAGRKHIGPLTRHGQFFSPYAISQQKIAKRREASWTAFQ